MLRFPRLLCGLFLLVLALLAGCTRLTPPGPDQPLVVGLPADPVFQQSAPDSEGMHGFSRDLVKDFARELGVEVRFVTHANHAALTDELRKGKIHMAVAIPLRDNPPGVSFGPAVIETRQLIVQHASGLPLDDPARLAEREISVLPDSAQLPALQALAIDPPPRIVVRNVGDETELFAGVARRRFDLAAGDELHFDIASNFHPDLGIAMELPGKLAYAWAVPAAMTDLLERATRFVEKARQDGTLRRLNDRYFGHIKRLDARDIQSFLGQMRSRLPNYRNAFQEAQEITGIDWRLLAALGYQESQWDPLATSPTGVRGLMMLTAETADRLGVVNRLDGRESILAGSKYLAMLMDELPDEIKQPDRLWFALAAYNLGMGHLRGGRRFAPGLKRDPNLWVDMKDVLPLLSRPEYYERLKSGRARGGEAVILVENIRNYYDVLSRFEPIYTPPSLGAEEKLKRVKKRSKPQRGAGTVKTSTPPM